MRIIAARLKQVDCVRKGWVMHSLPGDRQQVLALQSLGIYPKHYGEREKHCEINATVSGRNTVESEINTTVSKRNTVRSTLQ